MPDQCAVLVLGRPGIEVIGRAAHVALLGHVDAPEMADVVAPGGVRGSADAGIGTGPLNDRRRDQVIAFGPILGLSAARFDGIAPELPDHLAILGIEAIKIAVAARTDHLALAIDFSIGE